MHVFVDQHGRITLIGLASDRGTIIHDDRGLLDTVLYDNGYADLYAYFDNDHVIEVTRENDEGQVASVFRFNFTDANATKWGAGSNEMIERPFDLGEAFYDRLVAAVFEQQQNTGAGSQAISSGLTSFRGSKDCVCRTGDDTSCEGFDQRKQCEQGTCGVDDNKACVWRGNDFFLE